MKKSRNQLVYKKVKNLFMDGFTSNIIDGWR